MTGATTDIEAPAHDRRLATIERITELAPIPDADAIVRARIRGWDVVVRVGEFEPGDRCVYVEVDSMLPSLTDERFAFLASRGIRTATDGRQGHVLRTARLRGQYSQGLALPLAAFPEVAGREVGDDVTGPLGIVKWDPPLPASLAGRVRGNRPGWIRRSDEERIQNLAPILATAEQVRWVATEKLDGSSMTAYVQPADGDQDEVRGACSRELDLLPADGNALWQLAREHDLHERLKETFPGARAAVQGEAFGSGIQKNPLRMDGHRLAVYALLVDGRELARDEWPSWATDLSVPVRDDLTFPGTVGQALADVDGLRSVLADRAAEGVVWRATDTTTVQLPDGQIVRASFKVISNRYLLKHDS